MTPRPDDEVTVAEKMASSTAEIVRELIVAHKKREDVNLNKLKTKIGKKYKLKSQPRLGKWEWNWSEIRIFPS